MINEVLRMEKISLSDKLPYRLTMGNFTVFEKEVAGLIGLSNSGHAALIKVLIGDLPKSRGYITIDGKDVVIRSPEDAKKLGIYYIHHSSRLYDNLSISENVLISDGVQRMPFYIKKPSIWENAKSILNSAGIDINPDRKAEGVTLAQQHLIILANLVRSKPRLLILDNIILHYTEHEIAELVKMIRVLTENDISVIYLFSNISNFIDYTDRLTIMRNGATVKTLERSEYDRDMIIRYMVGEQTINLPNGSHMESGKETLRVEGLGTKGGLKGLSFSVNAGETVAIVDDKGVWGAEIANILSGKDCSCYSAGRIYLNGELLSIRSRSDSIAAGICTASEDAGNVELFSNLSIQENLVFNSLKQISFLGILKPNELKFVYNEFLNMLKEETGVTVKKGRLSELNEQGKYTLLFYKWMLTRPKVIIMINPSTNNDEQTKEYIYFKIRQANEKGIAVVIITNDLLDAFKYCQKVIRLE